MAITIIPPLYLYTIQMRMVTSYKAKFNFWQVGPTESETLIGLITLLPAAFGKDVYEQIVFASYGIQVKHIAASAYLIVQFLLIMDCVVEALWNNASACARMYAPMVPLQALFFIGCTQSSLNYLGNYGFYNLMFQTFFHLQYILLTVEDLTGASKSASRFPGFDYLLVTLPFAFHHLTQPIPLRAVGMDDKRSYHCLCRGQAAVHSVQYARTDVQEARQAQLFIQFGQEGSQIGLKGEGGARWIVLTQI
ncbi:hypothetical protein FGO68_gene4925 [Halteria grandinella]|uniref:Uncharacterized protein n=1 Tax=Halteria grandinella TaxID=5974 RepID=A0A8J8NVZ3_HALGN|nr:hypothetical protein FGO68_gene4925 [Halteria grandinella]